MFASRVMNISDYSDTIGDCNSDFDIVYGKMKPSAVPFGRSPFVRCYASVVDN